MRFRQHNEQHAHALNKRTATNLRQSTQRHLQQTIARQFARRDQPSAGGDDQCIAQQLRLCAQWTQWQLQTSSSGNGETVATVYAAVADSADADANHQLRAGNQRAAQEQPLFFQLPSDENAKDDENDSSVKIIPTIYALWWLESALRRPLIVARVRTWAPVYRKLLGGAGIQNYSYIKDNISLLICRKMMQI